MNKQSMVDEFMRLAGQYKGLAKPTVPDLESRRLRVRLIQEELNEFVEASGLYNTGLLGHNYLSSNVDGEPYPTSIVDAADAIADLLYVVYGAAIAWGIHIDQVFGAVHQANMEKFGPGSSKREDGKWMKPPDWTPPDIKAVLEAQGWNGSSEEMRPLQTMEADNSVSQQ